MTTQTSSTPAAVLPIYLDCDTGIDDAMALLYLHAHPGAELLGIGTVSGNVDAERAALNTLALLEMLAANVPVAVGARDPLTGRFGGGAKVVHGSTGNGSVQLQPTKRRPETDDAAELLIRLAAQHSGQLRVIATGPLTNLAVALKREPALVDQIAEVTVMAAPRWGQATSPRLPRRTSGVIRRPPPLSSRLRGTSRWWAWTSRSSTDSMSQTGSSSSTRPTPRSVRSDKCLTPTSTST